MAVAAKVYEDVAHEVKPVFGLLKQCGKDFTVVIPGADAKTTTLLPIIREQIKSDSIVYTDTSRSYNALDAS